MNPAVAVALAGAAIAGAFRSSWSPCGESMLASINPVTERARHQRWGVTVTVFAIASTLTGAAIGGVLGLLGKTVGASAAVWIIAPACLLAVAADLRFRRMPPAYRQVNERWLARYRGWVYGAGFGFQLGTGVATVVMTAAVYVTWMGAFVSGSPAFGMILGTFFGATRGAILLSCWRAENPEDVRRVMVRMHSWSEPSRWASIGALAGTALIAVVARVG